MKKVLFIFLPLLLLSLTSNAQRRAYKNITEKNGKVGIGTTQPDELLTVKGKIHSQEVLVDLEGAVAPDYVFEAYYMGKSDSFPTYKRYTLPELNEYLATHKHLPGVPSAKHLSENGMELKAMNLLLLEKIEELTLYTLEQQKQIDALKQQIVQLQKE